MSLQGCPVHVLMMVNKVTQLSSVGGPSHSNGHLWVDWVTAFVKLCIYRCFNTDTCLCTVLNLNYGVERLKLLKMSHFLKFIF